MYKRSHHWLHPSTSFTPPKVECVKSIRQSPQISCLKTTTMAASFSKRRSVVAAAPMALAIGCCCLAGGTNGFRFQNSNHRDNFHRTNSLPSRKSVQDRTDIHRRRSLLRSGQSFGNLYVRKLTSTSTSFPMSDGSQHPTMNRYRLGNFSPKRSPRGTTRAALFLSRMSVTSTPSLTASINGLDDLPDNRGKDSITLRQRLKSRLLKLLLLPWVSQSVSQFVRLSQG